VTLAGRLRTGAPAIAVQLPSAKTMQTAKHGNIVFASPTGPTLDRFFPDKDRIFITYSF